MFESPSSAVKEAIPRGIVVVSSNDGHESFSLPNLRKARKVPEILRGRYIPNVIDIPSVKITPGSPFQNTFNITEKHVQLRGLDHEGAQNRDSSESSNKVTGVRFNVETVPDALPEHLHKPVLSRSEECDRIRQDMAERLYRQQSETPKFRFKASDIRIEAASKHEPNLVYAGGGHGFLVAAVVAFAQHLPLQLSPDHIWSLITYAFAKHVEENANALQSKFVKHQGKKRLVVRTPDSFLRSIDGDPDSGASAADWERLVFGQFSEQIRGHIGEESHERIVADFSTTSPSTRAASEITLMSATKHYFSFGMMTLCGIPNITLQGTEEDWVSLRKRAEDLAPLMLEDFSGYWMPLLLPVLDEFINSYRGEVNHGFWQSMVKLRHNGMSSGYKEFISGWMQIFFPYLVSGLNTTLRPWHEMFFHGPDPADFPPIVSSVPVDWNYYGSDINLDFHAGMTGVTQDSYNGTLGPVVGWYVTQSPPMPGRARDQGSFRGS